MTYAIRKNLLWLARYDPSIRALLYLSYMDDPYLISKQGGKGAKRAKAVG